MRVSRWLVGPLRNGMQGASLEKNQLFVGRFPSQMTKPFSDRLFVQPEFMADHPVTRSFPLQSEDRPVTQTVDFPHGTITEWVTARFSKGLKSTSFKTFLVSPNCAGRIAEGPSDIVLIRVCFLDEHDHRVSLGHTISDSVVV